MSNIELMDDKMKQVVDYIKAKENFLNMLDNILQLTKFNYKIDGDFIGEVHMAGFNYNDITYLAMDCGIVNKITNESHGDTLFIPMEYFGLTNDQLENIEDCKITLLSIESERFKSPTEQITQKTEKRLLN